MNTSNSHIEQFLEYYFHFDKSPEYAVLLKGKWGVGKTWFIKKSLKELERKQKNFLYVSLYGIKNTSEIEEEFFKQLHPLLSSKTLGVASKIAKGLLKTTIKIDLDGDGNGDANLRSQIPDIELPKYLTNTDEYILIFDDLERCSMEIGDILGYINHFVEHQGYKVIVIANEEKFVSHVSDVYLKIKEKLIGKTFEISPNLDAALRHFIDDIDDSFVQGTYKENTHEIKELFEKSQYKNLRHLKQSLWEFERLCKDLQKEFKTNKAFILDFLKLFLCFSFEIKSGEILPTDIPKLSFGLIARQFNQDNDEKNQYELITEKYENIYFGNLIIEESLWVDILDKGYFNYQSIKESLHKSSYFESKSTPDWVKLWHYHNLTNDEYECYLKKVSKEFLNMEHKELGVVKHLVGLFLSLADMNLYNHSKSEVLNFSKKYIDNLKQKNNLPIIDPNVSGFRDSESWGGLGFMGRNFDEYNEFLSYLNSKREETTLESYPDIGKELLKLMKVNVNDFYKKITASHSDSSTDQSYYQTPILTYIEPEEFVSTLVNIDPPDMRIVFYALENRYKEYYYAPKIQKELKWLKAIKKLIKVEIENSKGKLSSWRLEGFLNNELEKGINNLKNFSEQK